MTEAALVLMGSHETIRKRAHPLPNVPASAFRPFQLRVLFPGESHPCRTGYSPCCGPRTEKSPLPAVTDSTPRASLAQRAAPC